MLIYFSIDPEDEEFLEEGTADGWMIKLQCQPPNSPDLNVLDLGYFRSIQPLQYETPSYSIDELVQTVLDSFDKLEPSKLESIFLTLQGCILEMLKCRGGNNYKLPHMGKARLS